MEKENVSIKLTKSNFAGFDSNFIYSSSLSTTAHQSKPFYSQISVISGPGTKKIVGAKTDKSLILVYYENDDYQDYKKIEHGDEHLEKDIILFFCFAKDIYSDDDPPYVLIGYKSGIVAYVNCTDFKVTTLYNFNEKTKEPFRSIPVTNIVLNPYNYNEFIVFFMDSSCMKFILKDAVQKPVFFEKLKKFESKYKFSKSKKIKEKKTKDHISYSAHLSETNPEFQYFHIKNADTAAPNPVEFYKFNHRTISEVCIRNNDSMKDIFNMPGRIEDLITLTFASYDGYIIIFELNGMEPILSYKTYFGGISSFNYTEDGEKIIYCGQDDCITVLDLRHKATVKLEGHTSFATRCITQNIRAEGKEFTHMRLIAGSMDSSISFWEFRKNLFDKISKEDSSLPLRLKQHNLPEKVIKPLHKEQVRDSVAWVELVGKMLLQCCHDGSLTVYTIKNLNKNEVQPPEEEKLEANGIEPLRLKHHESSDFHKEQLEYNDGDGTVSTHMSNIEQMVNNNFMKGSIKSSPGSK